MSNIDEQIKALQLKKKKIDYVSYIADLIKNDNKCLDFMDVQKEVVAKIEPFLINLMNSIENDTDVVTNSDSNQLTEAQLKVLKIVADKVINKPDSLKTETPKTNVVKPTNNISELSPSEKMNFALNHRHLADKSVQVINDEKVTITGKVVGLDAPYVHVKTETGPTIKVPVEKIVLI